MELLQTLALWLSGAIGFSVPTCYAWKILKSDDKQNIAAWGMTLVLDAAGLFLMLKAGNEDPLLQAGWTIAAFFIVIAVVLGKSTCSWGWVESICMICCCVAGYLWITEGPKVALWAQTVAMIFAASPIAIDYYKEPAPQFLWLWQGTMVACALAILGAPQKNVASLLIPSAAFLMNALIAFLCSRRLVKQTAK